MKRKLSPATSLLVSLTLVVGILVCDLTGHKLLTGARAQTDTAPSPCTTPSGESTVVSSYVSVAQSGIVGGSVTLEGLKVDGSYVDVVAFQGDIEIIASTLAPVGDATVNGVLVGDSVTSAGGVLVGDSVTSAGGVLVGDSVTSAGGVLVGDSVTSEDSPCRSGVLVGDSVTSAGGVLVGDSITAIGGVLVGDSIQINDGVVTGSNLKLIGATITGSGISINGAVIIVGSTTTTGN